MYWVDSGYDCWRPHPLANWVTIVSTALCHVSVISKGPACQYTFDGIVQESAAQRVYLLSMHSSRWRWWCVYQIICGCEKLNCKIRLAPRSSVLHILGKVEQFEVSLNTEHPPPPHHSPRMAPLWCLCAAVLAILWRLQPCGLGNFKTITKIQLSILCLLLVPCYTLLMYKQSHEIAEESDKCVCLIVYLCWHSLTICKGIFIQCNGNALVTECIRTVSRWTLMLIVMKWRQFPPPPSLEEEKLIWIVRRLARSSISRLTKWARATLNISHHLYCISVDSAPAVLCKTLCFVLEKKII